MTAKKMMSTNPTCIGTQLRWLAASAALLVAAAPATAVAWENSAEAERRLARTAQYLSGDDMEGRGLGTEGLQVAGRYIRGQMEEAGLDLSNNSGSGMQRFSVTASAEMGDTNKLALIIAPPDDAPREVVDLKSQSQFTPLAIGGGGSVDLPLVFVGYGITAAELEYDDYDGIDVDGKAVIILRHEPQQDNPHSRFSGTQNSRHAPFRRKISNAYQHGARAIIFCTDLHEIDTRQQQFERRWQVAADELAEAREKFQQLAAPTAADATAYRARARELSEQITRYQDQRLAEQDPVLEFTGAGSGGESRDIPVWHVQRAVVDRLLSQLNRPSLAELEAEIDKAAQPVSFDIPEARVVGQVDIRRQEIETFNVIGVLEGSASSGTVIVGAHYDHLGRGDEGSAQPGSKEIHNGADDNASGISVLLEIARRLVQDENRLPRRVVFIAFTGEERGLLGSARYVREPLYPLDDTVAMINLDMVGRLDDNKLIVHGTGTAKEFDGLVDELNELHGFSLTKEPGGFGPSDHSSFYGKQIPVLHVFTGAHDDYHRPSDDFVSLNINGMQRITDFVVDLTRRIAGEPNRPTYVEVAPSRPRNRSGNPRPYFGSIPDFSHSESGYGLSGVAPESPAARGGLQSGDIIVKLGEHRVGNLEDFDGALRKYSAGDRVPVVVLRKEEPVTLEVVLDPPR